MAMCTETPVLNPVTANKIPQFFLVCPTKYLQHLSGTLFASIFCSGENYALFGANLNQSLKQLCTFNGAIWDEFSEQH